MNRAFLIILTPPLLVLIGYSIVFRFMGVSPEYWRVIVPVVLMSGALWWFSRRSARKARSSAP
jgi:ABC-type glycerol-3-phosphate transport system permease component